MAFPVERYTQRLQEREIPGTQLNAAVDCWFTAEGKTMPQFCKIEGTEGELITIRNIRILKEEQKFYSGMFYPEECVWKIVI